MARDLKGPETQTVGQLLLHICRLTADRMRVKMEEIGLHRAQGFALFHLAKREGVPQSEIARGLHLSAASVTGMLQRMERDGWVVRVTDEDDQRVSRVYLTPKARELQREAHECFRELEREVIGALTEAEQTELHALLTKVHARLAERSLSGRLASDLGAEGEEGA